MNLACCLNSLLPSVTLTERVERLPGLGSPYSHTPHGGLAPHPQASSKTIAAGRSHSALYVYHCPIWPQELETCRKATVGQEESRFNEFCWPVQSSTRATAQGTHVPCHQIYQQISNSSNLHPHGNSCFSGDCRGTQRQTKPVRKNSTTTFTSKNRTPGDFDQAGLTWHSGTFLTVRWLLALGPISREKRLPGCPVQDRDGARAARQEGAALHGRGLSAPRHF